MASRARKKDVRSRSVPSPGGKRRTIGAGEASERTFRAIFGAAPDPILLISLKPNLSPGLILEANPAAVRLFGYSREEILEIDPGARIIVSSGYAVSPIMSADADYGCAGAIAKPYKIGELSEVFQAVLAR